MKSNVKAQMKRIRNVIDERLDDSGDILVDGIQGSIEEQGLIDTGTMLKSIRAVRGENEVHAGTGIDNPPYPFFLNEGFRHYQSGEIVGPYKFLQKGVVASEGPLIVLWKAPIDG
jgi:hypothetical protein